MVEEEPAPRAPAWIGTIIRKVLADPRTTVDTVLVVADALDEAILAARAQADGEQVAALIRLVGLRNALLALAEVYGPEQ